MMESVSGVVSSTVICVRLFGPLEVSRRLLDGCWQVVKKDEWTMGTPPRSVLKRLLTTPGRRLSRSDIEDDLWPDAGMDLADRNLANALMVLLPLLAAYRKLAVPCVAVVIFSAFTSFPPPFPPVRNGDPGTSVSAPLLGLTFKMETVLGEKLSLV